MNLFSYLSKLRILTKNKPIKLKAMDNWEVIYTSNQLYEAEMVRNIMEDHDIECVIMNKQDSMRLFGEIEIWVPNENVLAAKQLIIKFEGE